MRGMYVDESSCMVLILCTSEDTDTSEFGVYGCYKMIEEEWHGECSLDHATSKVTLVKTGVTTLGTRDESGTITWESGVTWSPVYMSTLQFAFLTRRPYFPIGLALIMYVHSFARNVATLLLRKKPPTHIV